MQGEAQQPLHWDARGQEIVKKYAFWIILAPEKDEFGSIDKSSTGNPLLVNKKYGRSLAKVVWHNLAGDRPYFLRRSSGL